MSSAQQQPKKLSKFFRVAVEGATTDGRNIERGWIEQMGRNYDPKKYGARVWLEHLRGLHPESTFRAYGDVVATKAEEIEIDGKKKLALFARIAPLPELIDLNSKGQKIYTSMEVTPKFSDSGEAYLTGLAVTDSPASLGTDVLQFAQQKPDASPFKGRKSHADSLFSEAIPVDLEFEDASDSEAAGKKFSDSLRTLMERFTGRGKSDDARFAQVVESLEAVADAMDQQNQHHNAERKKDREAFAALERQFKELQTKLASTPGGNYTQRPPATGGSGDVQTDC